MNGPVSLSQAQIEMGAGPDVLSLEYEVFLGSTTIDMGTEDDTVTISVGGAFELLTGDGDDVVEAGFIEGLLDTGAGRDHVSITGDTGSYGALQLDPMTIVLGPDHDSFTLGSSSAGAVLSGSVDMGSGRDLALITGGPGRRVELDELFFDLGAHDDVLRIGAALVGTAVFDGGTGRDRYLDLGGNGFPSGAPELRNFELPKTTPRPELEFSTRIEGRVLLEDGSTTAAPESIDGLQARNVVVQNPSGRVLGAAWDSADLVGNGGRLTLLMDKNWMDPGSNIDVLENLHVFLKHGPKSLRAR